MQASKFNAIEGYTAEFRNALYEASSKLGGISFLELPKDESDEFAEKVQFVRQNNPLIMKNEQDYIDKMKSLKLSYKAKK